MCIKSSKTQKLKTHIGCKTAQKSTEQETNGLPKLQRVNDTRGENIRVRKQYGRPGIALELDIGSTRLYKNRELTKFREMTTTTG